MSSVEFSFNGTSDQQLTKDYMIFKKDIVRITSMIGWAGFSARNDITMIGLRRIASFYNVFQARCGGRTLKKYGMFIAQMSENFLEMVEKYVNAFGYALELKGDRMSQ